MTEQEQVEKSIEISIEAAKSIVARKLDVEILFKNRSFKRIVEEGYFKEEAARLVSLLTDPEFSSEERQAEIRNDMVAISGFRQYLLNLHRLGVQMESTISSSEAQLEEMRNEEQEG